MRGVVPVALLLTLLGVVELRPRASPRIDALTTVLLRLVALPLLWAFVYEGASSIVSRPPFSLLAGGRECMGVFLGVRAGVWRGDGEERMIFICSLREEGVLERRLPVPLLRLLLPATHTCIIL